MKSYNEIISRFDKIKELSVSEEMLGAYIEGNLDMCEMESLSRIIQDDSQLKAITEEILLIPVDDISVNKLYPDFESDNPDMIASDNVHYGYIGKNNGFVNNSSDAELYDEDSFDYNISDYDGNTFEDNGCFDENSFELPELPDGIFF